MPHTPIVQFGTSRFLQAHADLYVSEALKKGRALGPITVVQSSGDPSRSRRLKALAADEGYDVRVRGIEHGQLVDTTARVTSIVRTLSLPDDLEQVSEIVSDQARVILSNTADAGFRPREADKAAKYSQDMSYPAKLTWLLFRRFEAHGAPIQVMPTELVPHNGAVLRDLVFTISDLYPAAFRDWLERDVVWVNSLVDRIVSEPLEPAGAVAEPYSLWAVEDQPGLVLPCEHRRIKVVASLEEAETLKLFVLNLGHTFLVSRWLGAGGSQHRYVRDMLNDPAVCADLEELYASEVVPGFGAHGRGREAEDYVATTLDRFKNPFLDHKLADIAQNHTEKVKRRIASFLSWVREADPDFDAPRLEEIAAAPATVHMLP
ncbi:mannitol dehydrogenase family protein [uncultured Roseibium sp.]|uniref:mannitol dehydrogenase family protein n=1 Tax=uncultured Roseibium sp. TaxID=1936171 RepID=UPI002630BD86|nr:mannitol dehydrogenase family protein [uncultured Roseibium sp.]